MSGQESGKNSDGIARIARLLTLEREELAPAGIGAGYFFFLLLSYYLLRPVRETFGISGGYDNLPWLMTGTLVAMALASPVFAVFASRVPRRVLVPWTYRFFAMNIVVFWALLMFTPRAAHAGIGYGFYIWLSVFNLFVVSVFWAVMADVFGPKRGRRAFAVAAVGGTLGAIGGAWTAAHLSTDFAIKPAWLMLIALVPLELAVQCVRLLRPYFDRSRGRDAEGGDTRLAQSHEPSSDPLAGLKLIASSPYLIASAVYIMLFTTVGTLVYMEQGRIVEQTFSDRAERVAAFAKLDLWTNVLTLVTQLFLTARIVQLIGVRGSLVILPIVNLAGFAALWMNPVFGVLAAFQVVRRGVHYAVDRPVREMLFTVLGADARYKSKTFIDTFVYRAGDMAGGWSPLALKAMGLAVAPVALPVVVVWLGVAAVLGKLHAKQPPLVPPPPPGSTCEVCGYELAGLDTPGEIVRCPECGARNTARR